MSDKLSQRLLHMWRAALLEGVRSDDPDLTMRQMTLLLTVYLLEPPHTVRGLALELNVAKPVITRALDTLSRRGLIKRKRDESDRRNVIVQRTVKGAVYLSELSDRVSRAEKNEVRAYGDMAAQEERLAREAEAQNQQSQPDAGIQNDA
ncbi:MarR family transcriptional regulator [Yunchengibacter salinarum]|uniref:MarR family transcriptional regulator n=1 Tax=Yunchengibacter salinarum TaxID=3133399 RepID=UPI0035B5B3C1